MSHLCGASRGRRIASHAATDYLREPFPAVVDTWSNLSSTTPQKRCLRTSRPAGTCTTRHRDRRRPRQPPPPVRRVLHRDHATIETSVSAPPTPWACATSPPSPGGPASAGSSRRTSEAPWSPGRASSAATTTPNRGTPRPGNAPLPDRAPRPPRPAEDPGHQPRLAMEGGIPLLPAPLCASPHPRSARPSTSLGRRTTSAVGADAHPDAAGSSPLPAPSRSGHKIKNRSQRGGYSLACTPKIAGNTGVEQVLTARPEECRKGKNATGKLG
jgi:hypothetical protein